MQIINEVVVQHNAITSARYDFDSCQLDVLFMLLASLGKNDEPDKSYTIHVKDIQEITGRQWNYQQFNAAVSSMGKRDFFVPLNNGWRQIFPFDSVDYIPGEGLAKIKLGRTARSYFFHLKEEFTVMQLRSLLLCSSKYAKRIYGLACQWKNLKGSEKTISLSQLKETLFLKDPKNKKEEQFTNITTFKKFVLDLATKQINEHTDLTVTATLKKQGRSYADIHFAITKKTATQTEIDFKVSVEYQKTVAYVTAYGLSKSIGEEIADNGKLEQFKKVIVQLNTLIREKKIEPNNNVAYLTEVLRDKKIILSVKVTQCEQ